MLAVCCIIAFGINCISAYVSPSNNNPRGIIRQPTGDESDDIPNKRITHLNSQNNILSTSTSNNPYIRIQKRGRHYDIQTAITTFQKVSTDSTNIDTIDNKQQQSTTPVTKKTTTVHLHAQIHFGDKSYYEYFNNDDIFTSQYDKILYELIVEDRFITTSTKQLIPAQTSNAGGKVLNPIVPSISDLKTANQYGLTCQIDGIEYCKDGWVHADLTREEFIEYLEQGNKQKQGQRNEQPLWALASTTATYPGSELVTSLLRPLSTSTSNSAKLTRRLFTHLFLPGDALSGWIRAALWLSVPSPELSIMLVDWSSLSYLSTRSRRRSGKDDNSNITPISSIAAPVFLSLLTGNWGTARRLVFGQVLVSGQSNADTSKAGVLIDKRNDRAMETLRESLDGNSNKKIALLYGAGHCHDLQSRLQDEGMTPIRTEWRTAFRATAPKWGDFVNTDEWKSKSSDIASSLPAQIQGEEMVRSMSPATLESVAVGLVILPLYLLVGGFDWISTMGELGTSLDKGMYLDGLADVLLYLVRHVALYVGIAKFVVDWGNADGIFDEDDERA